MADAEIDEGRYDEKVYNKHENLKTYRFYI